MWSTKRDKWNANAQLTYFLANIGLQLVIVSFVYGAAQLGFMNTLDAKYESNRYFVRGINSWVAQLPSDAPKEIIDFDKNLRDYIKLYICCMLYVCFVSCFSTLS